MCDHDHHAEQRNGEEYSFKPESTAAYGVGAVVDMVIEPDRCYRPEFLLARSYPTISVKYSLVGAVKLC